MAATAGFGRPDGAEAEPIDDRDSTLTTVQALAVNALMAGAGTAQAAKLAGCGERTLRRWRRENPAFRAALRLARAELRASIQARLTNAAAAAVVVLEKTLRGRKVDRRLKLHAAALALRLFAATEPPEAGLATDEEGVALELALARQRRGLQRMAVKMSSAYEDLGRGPIREDAGDEEAGGGHETPPEERVTTS
jgi:hypothetical protein